MTTRYVELQVIGAALFFCVSSRYTVVAIKHMSLAHEQALKEPKSCFSDALYIMQCARAVQRVVYAVHLHFDVPVQKVMLVA